MPYPLMTHYKNIICIDSLNCMSICNMELGTGAENWNRVTTDGGQTWFTSLSDTVITGFPKDIYSPHSMQTMAYPNKKLCLISCDSGYIWKSTDTGKNWKKIKSNLIHLGSHNISFGNEYVGGIVSGSYCALSTDGGESFKVVDFVYDGKNLGFFDDIFITKDSIIYLSTLCYDTLFKMETYKLYILKSTDLGKTWVKSGFLDKILSGSLYFINSNEGWIGGYHKKEVDMYAYEIIYHTTDGGMTWKKQLDESMGHPERIKKILFFDKNNGIALSTNWNLWKTNNNGKDWVLDTSYKYENINVNNIGDSFFDISFLTKDKLIGVCANYGQTWLYGDQPVSVEESLLPINCTVSPFPNPSTAGEEIKLKFQLSQPAKITLSVFDIMGNEIISPETFSLDQGTQTLSLSEKLPAGTWFVRVEKDNKYYGILKIIVY
jgi:photosystem II stability/assembly factor-like uncharacterized protein